LEKEFGGFGGLDGLGSETGRDFGRSDAPGRSPLRHRFGEPIHITAFCVKSTT
jgi:hypothetical protein